MTEPKTRGSLLLLLGDWLFYLAVFIAAVLWRRDSACVMGSAIAVPAFVLWMVAKVQLGSSFTLKPEARALVSHGLYSRIRHPVYLFSSLALVGMAICIRNLYFSVYVGLGIAAQLWRIRRENKVLLEKLGQQYFEYQRKTWF